MIRFRLNVFVEFYTGVLGWSAAITKYCRIDGLSVRRLVLTVLKAGKSKIKAPAGLVPGEGLLPGP